MVLATTNQRSIPQHYRQTTPKPNTVIVVYEQPKVYVVRRYTKTIVPHMNPDEYEKQFNRVLLDTSALLALTRRLNIQDNLV
jgi:hypothetical protein